MAQRAADNDDTSFTPQMMGDQRLSGWHARKAGQPYDEHETFYWRAGWRLQDEVIALAMAATLPDGRLAD